MIIWTEGARLRLVTQVDHAALAATFAAAWGGAHFHPPEPLAAVELATRVHDQGWSEWDQQPRLQPETGLPYDFLIMPPDEHINIYERCIQSALDEHPYAGLLVSLHGAGLYRKRYGYMPHLAYKEVDEPWKPLVEAFLERQGALQAELTADLRPDPTALWTHYRWLQAWDALSVFVCRTDPREQGSFHLGALPTCPGGAEEAVCVRGAGAATYTVSPWPFAVRRIEVMVPVRYVPSHPYADDDAFLSEFDAAPTQALPCTLIPAP